MHPLTPSPPHLSRRGLFGLGAVAAIGASCGGVRPALALEPRPERALHLHVCLTGESFAGVFWAAGRPLSEAMARLEWLLRDPHRDRCRPIDLALLHRLSAMQERLDSDRPFEVLSGFRTPETNRHLLSQGAVPDSMHLVGRAVDLRMPGRRTADIYRCALDFAGGSGFYGRRGFVHVDSGPTRRWRGA